MIGKIISHYKIIEELGGGGMGVVYKAEDTKLKRPVALKFLPQELTRDPEAKKRFSHEAQAASILQHNNICSIHEIDETEDGQLFISMDYYQGETLKKKIERGPLKIKEAINIAIQVASGLASAHEAKMVHRDIKPANIMITSKNIIKIVDFGLAKLKGQTKLTREGTTLGTVAYMSPEQAQGEQVDHRSDIWSLGIMLYEMVTGQLPFKGDYEQAIMYAILNEDSQPATALRTGVPMELEQIIHKILAKNPDERYQHADDLIVDLKRVYNVLETSAKIPITTSKIETIPKAPKSFKKYLVTAAAIVLLVIAYLLIKPLIVEEMAVVEPKPIVVISFKNQTGDASYDYLQEAIPNLLITKLVQSRFFQVISWERIYDLLKQLGKQDVDVIDQNVGFEICRLEGVEAIVLGSFMKAGDVFATDVKVLDVQSKQLIKSASSKGDGVGSILQNQIDDLGQEIAQSIHVSESSLKGSEVRVSDVTTSSMEGYHFFLRGQDAYDKMYYEDARNFLEKAVIIDSTFALAYLYLAWANGALDEDEARDAYYEKAKIYAYRAGKKDQMYIEAYYANRIDKNPDERFGILQEMAKRYPKEKRVYYDLGRYYDGQMQYQKAIDMYQQALRLDPNYAAVFNVLGYAYGDMGQFDKADEYLKKYEEAIPGDANPFDSYAELYLRTGRFEKAINKYKEALEVKPDFGSEWRIAYIYAMQEDYQFSLNWINQFITKTEAKGRVSFGYWWKGLYQYLSGNHHQAIRDLELSVDISKNIKSRIGQSRSDFLKAWIFLDQGKLKESRKYFQGWYDYRIHESPQYLDNHKATYAYFLCLNYLKQLKVDSAKAELKTLKKLFPELTPLHKERDYYNLDFLYSQILIAQDSLEQADKIYKNMKLMETPFGFTLNYMFYNFPFERDGLAQAFLQRGNIDRAILEYKKLIQIDPKTREWRLIYPKYHYRLAKLYQLKGRLEEAIEQYQLFLKIWSNADADLPELQDAKIRLANLTDKTS